jgi:phytoene synthase
VELRPAFDALFVIDDAMAEVVASASQPALAAIKLAWWRESLEKLDDAPAPAEPRLREAAAQLLTRGIKGRELAQLEDGWAALLEEEQDEGRIGERGVRLFAIASRLLGQPDEPVAEQGCLWAQVDVARRLGRSMPISGPPKMGAPKPLRPLTALAALATRDLRQGTALEPEATPGRAWTLLRHRITGR